MKLAAINNPTKTSLNGRYSVGMLVYICIVWDLQDTD